MRKRKSVYELRGIPLFILTVIFSFLVLCICTFIVSAIAYASDDPTAYLGIGSFAALLVCGAISGFSISRKQGEGGFGYSVLSSLSFVLIVLLIKLAFGGGAVSVSIVTDSVCYMGVATLFAFLGRWRKKRRHR